MNIYFAAPLHDDKDKYQNLYIVKILRGQGHKVYLPQEHGIWEELVEKYDSEEIARRMVRKMDFAAMRTADCCVAYQSRNRGPSEGMLWEMGWFSGANKQVYLLNTTNWEYNPMPEYGSYVVHTIDDLIATLSDNSVFL